MLQCANQLRRAGLVGLLQAFGGDFIGSSVVKFLGIALNRWKAFFLYTLHDCTDCPLDVCVFFCRSGTHRVDLDLLRCTVRMDNGNHSAASNPV